ncbi:hypothetical protein GCM10018966_053620 [Streptomyces yanii]
MLGLPESADLTGRQGWGTVAMETRDENTRDRPAIGGWVKERGWGACIARRRVVLVLDVLRGAHTHALKQPLCRVMAQGLLEGAVRLRGCRQAAGASTSSSMTTVAPPSVVRRSLYVPVVSSA